jgi:hypothetical protein
MNQIAYFDLLPNEILLHIFVFSCNRLSRTMLFFTNKKYQKMIGKKKIQKKHSICLDVAIKGSLNILKWAQYNNCPWNSFVCRYAIEYNHFDILKWATNNGCPWDTWVCSAAAREGNLKILKWLRKYDCPWNSMTCLAATAFGHLEVLQWAYDNGCDLDKDECIQKAEYYGYAKIINWLNQH